MLILGKPWRWVWVRHCLVVLGIWGFLVSPAGGADFSSRLAAGEIIFHTVDLPESGAKRGEATEVVDASPENV